MTVTEQDVLDDIRKMQRLTEQAQEERALMFSGLRALADLAEQAIEQRGPSAVLPASKVRNVVTLTLTRIVEGFEQPRRPPGYRCDKCLNGGPCGSRLGFGQCDYPPRPIEPKICTCPGPAGTPHDDGCPGKPMRPIEPEGK